MKVTDATNPKATNVFCFMVTDTANENFCRSICNENLLNESSTQRPESIDYFVSGSDDAAVTFTDEFTLMTQNKVMCPVLYYYEQTSSAVTEALASFDVSAGSF